MDGTFSIRVDTNPNEYLFTGPGFRVDGYGNISWLQDVADVSVAMARAINRLCEIKEQSGGMSQEERQEMFDNAVNDFFDHYWGGVVDTITGTAVRTENRAEVNVTIQVRRGATHTTLIGNLSPGGNIVSIPNDVWDAATSGASCPMELASRILEDDRIRLAIRHPVSPVDNDSVRDNIIQTSQGLPAQRSAHRNPDTNNTGPGGSVDLDSRVLGAINVIAEVYGDVFVSSLAGALHSATSFHYQGRAVDMTYIDNRRVGTDFAGRDVDDFVVLGLGLGATQVWGPGFDPFTGHDDHFHLGWPARPARPE